MAVSTETDWEKVAMYSDEPLGITPEQIRKKDLEARKNDYWKHGGTKATGLTDEEYKYVTGLPLSPKESEIEKPQEVPSRSPLEQIREWFAARFPKPHTHQKQPI